VPGYTDADIRANEELVRPALPNQKSDNQIPGWINDGCR